MTHTIHDLIDAFQRHGWSETKIRVRLLREGYTQTEIRSALSPQERLLRQVPDDLPTEWRIPLLRIVKAEAEAQTAKDPVKRALAAAEAQRLAEAYMAALEAYNAAYEARSAAAALQAEAEAEAVRPSAWRRHVMSRLLATPGMAK